MKNTDIGMLVITARKDCEWIVFQLDSGEKIRVVIKDHKSNTKTHNKVVIECPKHIKITREEMENLGNIK